MDIPYEPGSLEYRRAYYLANRERLTQYNRDKYRVARGISLDAPDQRFGPKRLRPRRETAWATLLRRNIQKSAKKRGIVWDGHVTAGWLRAQFERQQGRCFYTGIPFEMAIGARERGMRRPSVDRLDSAKGYVVGNVVLCLTAVNYMKNDYSAEGVVELLLDIVSIYG